MVLHLTEYFMQESKTMHTETDNTYYAEQYSSQTILFIKAHSPSLFYIVGGMREAWESFWPPQACHSVRFGLNMYMQLLILQGGTCKRLSSDEQSHHGRDLDQQNNLMVA